MGLLKGIELSHVCLDGFLIKLKLDDHILLVGDIGLRGICPLVCEVGDVSHLGDIVINDKVLEAERDVARSNPDTARSTSLRLNELLLLFLIDRGLLFFLLISLIGGMNIEGEASGTAPLLLRRGKRRPSIAKWSSQLIKEALFGLVDLLGGELTDVVHDRVPTAGSLDLDE
jgi:hypothetical protein